MACCRCTRPSRARPRRGSSCCRRPGACRAGCRCRSGRAVAPSRRHVGGNARPRRGRTRAGSRAGRACRSWPGWDRRTRVRGACHSIPSRTTLKPRLCILAASAALEVPRFARIRIGDERRVLVDDVRAVQQHDTPVGVVEIRSAGRVQEGRRPGARTLRGRPAARLVLDPGAAQGLDVRGERVEVGLIDHVLRRGRRGGGCHEGRRRRRLGSQRGRGGRRRQRGGRPGSRGTAGGQEDRPHTSAATAAATGTMRVRLEQHPLKRIEPDLADVFDRSAERHHCTQHRSSTGGTQSGCPGLFPGRRVSPNPRGPTCIWHWFSNSSSAHNICNVVCTRSPRCWLRTSSKASRRT